MKYMLFGYLRYYPKGGMKDFVGLFDSIEEAEKRYNEGYIPDYCDPDFYTQEEMEESREYYEEGQIVNATSLQVEKEL